MKIIQSIIRGISQDYIMETNVTRRWMEEDELDDLRGG